MKFYLANSMQVVPSSKKQVKSKSADDFVKVKVKHQPFGQTEFIQNQEKDGTKHRIFKKLNRVFKVKLEMN